ncbi:hypothetical protein [Thermococcus sp.]
MRRVGLLLIASGAAVLPYPLLKIPLKEVIYIIPYVLLTPFALRRKAHLYGASALAGWSFVEWTLSGDYLPIVGLALALISMPLSVESQRVKRWERALNLIIAGTLGYIALNSPPEFKLMEILAVLLLLSPNRVVSGGGQVLGSAVLMAASLNPGGKGGVLLGASLFLLLYSLHSLRKLLR